jgi:hypothetical protein
VTETEDEVAENDEARLTYGRKASALLGALALLALAVAGACGKDKGAATLVGTRAHPGTPLVVAATFTPVTPGSTPSPLQTRAAQQTAAAQTQTANPAVSPTAPPPIFATGTATVAANAVKAPTGHLATSAGAQDGAYGAFNWYDPAKDTGLQSSAPYTELPLTVLDWATGTPASVTIDASPYAVGGATVKIYTYDGNIVIPTDKSGNVVGQNYAFYPQKEPVQTYQLPGPQLPLTTNVAPGHYIVSVDVQWVVPDSLAALKGKLHTEYVFNVNVT